MIVDKIDWIIKWFVDVFR